MGGVAKGEGVVPHVPSRSRALGGLRRGERLGLRTWRWPETVWVERTEGMMGRGCVRGRTRGGVREPPPSQASKLVWGVGKEGWERNVGRNDR